MASGSGSGSNAPPNVTMPMLQRLDLEHFQAIPEWKGGIVRIVSRSILTDAAGRFVGEGGVALPFGEQPLMVHSSFTGFVVNEDFMVTAAHGVMDWFHHNDPLITGYRLRALEITDVGGVELEQAIITRPVAVDTGADLALLLLPERLRPTYSFKLAEGNVAVGQSVCTIGHPNYLPWDFKSGKVAHVNRPGNDSIPNWEQSPSGFFTIEVDYLTPPGYSGGPQITSGGEVIGVNQSTSHILNEVLACTYNFISYVVPVNFVYDLMIWCVTDVEDGVDAVFRRNDGKGQFHINLVNHAWGSSDPKLFHVVEADMERITRGLPE